MPRVAFHLAFLLVLSSVVVSFPSSERAEPLFVDAKWLQEHLNDPDLILLHIGDQRGFDSLHIPGAQYISRDYISTPRNSGLMLQLPSVSHLDSVFEAYGISNNSRIILYFGKDWVSPSARVFLTLDYLGLGNRTSLLDGGMPAWAAQGGKLTTEVVSRAKGKIAPQVNEQVIADIGYVDRALRTKDIAVVDCRTENYYSGQDTGVGDRSGHIPNSFSIPFTSLLDERNMLKSKDSLRAIFNTAGIEDGEEVVTYCHIGQQASLGYIVARYLGYSARLYDGSFEEWAKSGRPVESPSR